MKWVAGAVLLLLIGLVLQLGMLVYAMYTLLGVMAVSRFVAHSWIENVSASREVSRTEAEIGDRVAVIVALKNTGWLPVVWLLLEDSIPPSALQSRPPRIKLEGKRRALLSIGSRGETQLLYQIDFKGRGYYQVGPLLIESGDLFGLHRRYRLVTEPAYILVYPKVVTIPGYDLSSRRPMGEIRMTHRLFEDPTRISGVRPYQEGDALSRIHWRATARTGELHSKTYEPSSIAGLSIIIDFHQDRYLGRGEPQRSDLVVTTAASLAHVLSTMNQQVGLYTNARDAADRIRTEGYRVDFASRDVARSEASEELTSDRLRPVMVPTRRGAEQFQRIRETLARMELTDGLTLPELLVETSPHVPRDATVAVILPEVPEETAIALGSLRRSGYAVAAFLVMYDDEIETIDALGRLAAEQIETRLIRTEDDITNLTSVPV